MSAAQKTVEIKSPPVRPGLRNIVPSKKIDQVKELIEAGIELRMVRFHNPVNSVIEGTPEYAYYHAEPGLKPHRVARMWFTPHCLVLEQVGVYKLMPLSDIAESTVL